MPTAEQHEMELLRSRINRLEAQMDFIYKQFGVVFTENANPGDDPRVLEALKKRNLIEAIKVYREITNVGLAEAKAAVEEIQRRRGL